MTPARPRRVEIAVALMVFQLVVSFIYLGWFWHPSQLPVGATEALRPLLIVVTLIAVAIRLAILKAQRWALIVTVAFSGWALLASVIGLLRGVPRDTGSWPLGLFGFITESVAIVILLTPVSLQWFKVVRTAGDGVDSGDTLPVDGAWRNVTPRA